MEKIKVVAFVTIIEVVIKSEGLRKKPIFGEMQFRRLIEMFIETLGGTDWLSQGSERNFSTQTFQQRELRKHRHPQVSGCLINTIRKV